jgi:Leu/Phe-tRNA-protein transferase
MIYTVELRIRIEGIGVIQFNEFHGKQKLIERIQKWIYEVRKQYGYRDMVVECVKVNNEDITQKIAPTREE